MRKRFFLSFLFVTEFCGQIKIRITKAQTMRTQSSRQGKRERERSQRCSERHHSHHIKRDGRGIITKLQPGHPKEEKNLTNDTSGSVNSTIISEKISNCKCIRSNCREPLDNTASVFVVFKSSQVNNIYSQYCAP